MNVINFPVQFIYQSNPPQTGDSVNWLPIAFLILAGLSLAMLFIKKYAADGVNPKDLISSKLLDFHLWVRYNVYAKVICVLFAVIAFLAIAGSIMANNAYADNAQQDLNLDTGKITIYVSDSGDMTCSESNLINASGLIYNLEGTSVSLTDEAADSPLASSTVKIDSFGGCIYEGAPDGEVHDVKGIEPLYGSQATKINVNIYDLDKDSALSLCGKDVFVISVMRSEILNDYSWSEIENIANDISDKGEASEYYAAMKKAAENGETKTMMLGDGPDADRLFMRIIGINHDTIAGTKDKKAGLTFMATNAINQGFNYNNISYISDWYNSKMNERMNYVTGDIYNLLNNALISSGLSPVTVSKDYAKSYSNENAFSTEILTKNNRFFLPSYYEITGSTTTPGSETQFGQEGSKYEYMANDIWSTIDECTWHDDPQYYPGPVMNSVNWKGYLWLQGAGSEQFTNDVEAAFDACDAAGGCVDCLYKIGSWERTIDKDTATCAMSMTAHGYPNSHLASEYTSCVTPCYCLGTGTITESDLQPKPLSLEGAGGGWRCYAPVFPDNQVPDGVKFYWLNDDYETFTEINVNKMSDLNDDKLYQARLYYTNPKGATLYAVYVVNPAEAQYISSSTNWNTIASNDASVTYVSQFNDNSRLRKSNFETDYFGPEYWTGLNWHNNQGMPTADPIIYYNNINQVGGVSTGVGIGDENHKDSTIYGEYGSQLFENHEGIWCCVANPDTSTAEAYYWRFSSFPAQGIECGWNAENRMSDVPLVIFSRVFY